MFLYTFDLLEVTDKEGENTLEAVEPVKVVCSLVSLGGSNSYYYYCESINLYLLTHDRESGFEAFKETILIMWIRCLKKLSNGMMLSKQEMSIFNSFQLKELMHDRT